MTDTVLAIILFAGSSIALGFVAGVFYTRRSGEWIGGDMLGDMVADAVLFAIGHQGRGSCAKHNPIPVRGCAVVVHVQADLINPAAARDEAVDLMDATGASRFHIDKDNVVRLHPKAD